MQQSELRQSSYCRHVAAAVTSIDARRVTTDALLVTTGEAAEARRTSEAAAAAAAEAAETVNGIYVKAQSFEEFQNSNRTPLNPSLIMF